MNLQESYLLGLICGRGKIYETGRVVIEFAHNNEEVRGLSLCPNCKSASTKSKVDKKYQCKNSKCSLRDFEPLVNIYNQPEMTLQSLTGSIIPFLLEQMNFAHQILKNKSISLLILDFSKSDKTWKLVQELLGKNFDYHYGRVPKMIFTESRVNKIEFLNGFLDTSGFCNAGNHQGPRKTVSGHTENRQRVYIQIVRNWNMVIDIDEMLRNQLDLPVQTIRWAHPNLDDPELKSVNEGIKPQREHQIKLHPEYMNDVEFRISHKQALFKEIRDYNKKAGFTLENWIDSNKLIKISDMRPNHPLETHLRLPVPVRRHFDSGWQVALALGCKDMVAIANNAINPEVFAENGDSQDTRNLSQVALQMESYRRQLNKKFPYNPKIRTPKKSSKKLKSSVGISEADTYPVLEKFFNIHHFDGKSLNGEFFEIATLSLSSYAKTRPEIFEKIMEELEEYKIHIDLIGYDKRREEIIIVESKIETLTLEMLGQLLGYCLVAQPVAAYLVSTEELSPSLFNLLSAYPELLQYSPVGKIQLGKLDISTGMVTLR